MEWNQNIYVSKFVCTSFFPKITYLLIDSFPPHIIPVTWVSNSGLNKSYHLLFVCGGRYVRVGAYNYKVGGRKRVASK